MNGSVLAWLVPIAVLPFFKKKQQKNRSLLYLLSVSIDSPQGKKKREKGATAAGRPQREKAWLNFFVHSLSIANPTGILSSLFPPDHSYDFGYSRGSVLSPLCLKIMSTV